MKAKVRVFISIILLVPFSLSVQLNQIYFKDGRTLIDDFEINDALNKVIELSGDQREIRAKIILIY